MEPLQVNEIIELINGIRSRAGNWLSSWHNPMGFRELPAGKKSEILKLRIQYSKLRSILDILTNPDHIRYGQAVDKIEYLNFLYSTEESPFFYEADRPVPHEERYTGEPVQGKHKNAPRCYGLPSRRPSWRDWKMSKVILGGF